jgi:hypothetical protein
MKNLFVSYDIALKLKKLGFDEPCLAFWNQSNLIQKEPFLNGSKLIYYYQNNIGVKESPSICKENCTVPLYQQVIDWFRINYDIIIRAVPIYTSRALGLNEIYGYVPHCNYDDLQDEYDTYYKALDAAIYKAIKLIEK